MNPTATVRETRFAGFSRDRRRFSTDVYLEKTKSIVQPAC